MSAGKARRELALRKDEDFAASFASFDDALRALDMVPAEGRDREHSDRESEVLLERGRTHLLEGHHEAALADLERALSLTSDFNLVQHAGAHHPYLGEAHFELDDPKRAGESLGTPETLWQGQRMLAAVRSAEGQKPRRNVWDA